MYKALVIIGCLFLFASVFAGDEDNIYSGKVHNKQITGVERTFEGQLICVACDLKTGGARSDCDQFGHSLRFKTVTGQYLTLLPNKYSKQLLENNELPGDKIKITGYHYASAGVIDVVSYNIDGKTMNWCPIHNVMDSCMVKE